MHQFRRVLIVAAIGALALLSAGCGGGKSAKRERFDVTIHYVLEPERALPDGLTTVAVLDAGAEVQGDADAERARKWSTIAADMIEQMLHESAEQFDTGLTVADRRQTQKVLAEQDLKAAGLVDAATAAKAGKLLDVQALITSKLNVNIDVTKSKKTTTDVNLGRLAASAFSQGRTAGGAVERREAEAIARDMTVQCSFAMIDANTAEAYFQYAPPPYQRRDEKEPEPVFGHSYGEADLDEVDRYIGALVKTGVREFVSSFVPIAVEYSYTLESSRDESSAAGVAALRAEDYERARGLFEAAIAEDPKDDRSTFCLGITDELTGDFDAALARYKQVCGMRGIKDEQMAVYLAAKDRLSAQKDRIRKKEG